MLLGFLNTLILAQTADFDPEIVAKLVLTGIETGNWWLIAGPGLALIFWLFRSKIAPRWPAIEKFFNQPVVGYITPVVAAILGGVVDLAIAGQLTSWAALLGILPTALKVAFTAIATYIGIKQVGKQQDQAKAKAEAAIPTPQAAADSITKALTDNAENKP